MAQAGSKQLEAVIGDLEHKLDVIRITGRFETIYLNRFCSNESQGGWLREHAPHLVPPKDPAGNEPSDKQLGNIFESKYTTDPRFRQRYIQWFIYNQNV